MMHMYIIVMVLFSYLWGGHTYICTCMYSNVHVHTAATQVNIQFKSEWVDGRGDLLSV